MTSMYYEVSLRYSFEPSSAKIISKHLDLTVSYGEQILREMTKMQWEQPRKGVTGLRIETREYYLELGRQI
jgi:hypothetical protein